jgi:hypothetical protein
MSPEELERLRREVHARHFGQDMLFNIDEMRALFALLDAATTRLTAAEERATKAEAQENALLDRMAKEWTSPPESEERRRAHRKSMEARTLRDVPEDVQRALRRMDEARSWEGYCDAEGELQNTVAALVDHTRALMPNNGHAAPCYYCGEKCDVLAGNPGKWPIPLCHADDPGVVKWHHEGCVNARLRRGEKLEAVFTTASALADVAGAGQAEIRALVAALDEAGPPTYAKRPAT